MVFSGVVNWTKKKTTPDNLPSTLDKNLHSIVEKTLTNLWSSPMGYITVVISLGLFTSRTFFIGFCLQTDFYESNVATVYTVKFNPQTKPLTQRIPIAERAS